MGNIELDTLTVDSNLQNQLDLGTVFIRTHLVLQIIPKVGPRLFHTSFLLNDRLGDDARENRKSHRHTMIIVAVDARSILQRRVLLAEDDDTIIKLVRLYAKLGYYISPRPE